MAEAAEIEQPWARLPPGEYAIIELFGHTTLVGLVSEVERFGAKMMALQPLFNGALLPAVFHGGAAIYRMTPCSAKVAWEQQPKQGYSLPAAIRSIVPEILLTAPMPTAVIDRDFREVEEDEDVDEDVF